MKQNRKHRLLVVGELNWTDSNAVESRIAAVANPVRDWVLVTRGNPTGVDRIAENYALKIGLEIERHEADTEQYGKSAETVRDRELIAAGADLCLSFTITDSRMDVIIPQLAVEHLIPLVVTRRPKVEAHKPEQS